MEWYDFAIYGYFAATIRVLFFSNEAPRRLADLVLWRIRRRLSLATPVGGVIFGHIGDRVGRKQVLTIPVVMMGGATFVIGLLPGYDQIGIAAPIILVLMHHSDLTLIFLDQPGFALLIGWFYGVNSALQAELLSHHVRVSAFSVSCNITLALFGGMAPMVVTDLVARTADDFTPACDVMLLAVFSLIAVFSIRETKGRPLRM